MGQNRASVASDFVAELNDSVTVDCLTDPLTEDIVRRYDVSKHLPYSN